MTTGFLGGHCEVGVGFVCGGEFGSGDGVSCGLKGLVGGRGVCIVLLGSEGGREGGLTYEGN